MTGIDSWSTTPATNATADGGAINWAEGQAPSTVNNTARQMLTDVRNMANDLVWFQYGTGDQGSGNIAVPGVYASGTSFTIAGANVTAVYHAGRRVRAAGSGTGTIYGSISSSSFSTNTTVNVTWDSGSLSNETLVISLSQIPVTGKPLGSAALVDFAQGTWTPTATFSTVGNLSVSYGTHTGTYTRFADRVIIDFTITFTPTYTTSSGPLLITGLPFTASTSSPGIAAGSVAQLSASVVSYSGSLSLVLATTTQLAIVTNAAAVGQTALAIASFPSGVAFTINGSFTYKVQ